MSYKIKFPQDTFKTNMVFPTVIATVDNQNIPEEEHLKVINSEFVTNQAYGRFPTSSDKFILNTVPNIKSWIHLQLNRYAKEALGCDRLRITQSWAIKHENCPQAIYPHTHANSIVSGSYYIDAPTGSQGLTFQKTGSRNSSKLGPYIDYTTDATDKPWLLDWITYKAYTGRLILFPSHIMHGVLGNELTKQRRCVLAFNTWFEEPIGSIEALTYLD